LPNAEETLFQTTSGPARERFSGKRCYRLRFGLFCEVGLIVYSGLRLNLLENLSVSNGIGEQLRSSVPFSCASNENV
jgi:hypothetical protein